jgi:hypothetical protein
MRSETIFIPLIPPSLNSVYAGIHWTKRKKLADDMHKLTHVAAKHLEPFTGPVELKLRARLGKGKRAYDCSNYALGFKLAEDAIVRAGVLRGDESDKVVRVVIEAPAVDRERLSGLLMTITEIDYERVD